MNDDQEMTAVLDRAMGVVIADDALVAGATSRGRRLVARRRRRRATVGVGVAAVGIAVASVGLSARSAPRDVVVRDRAPSAATDLPTAAPTPSEVMPGEHALGDHLAAVLPGPSTLSGTRHTDDYVSATRAFMGGSVSATVLSAGSTNPAQAASMCDTVGSGHPRGENCLVIDSGWVLVSTVRPDVSGVGPADRLTDVRWFGRDGGQVDLQATNTPPGGGGPVSSAPVLDEDQLVALAISADWYADRG